MSDWADLRDRADALIQQTALDPVTIAQTLHHLTMLGTELTAYIGDPEDGLLKKAADLAIDAEARQAQMVDDLLGDGFTLTRARERAKHKTREDRRTAEQAKITADYAKGVLAQVNRRHFELMNTGKHIDAAIGGRRG